MSDGDGCTCSAHCEGECGCGADWTPQELIEARAKIADLESLLAELCIVWQEETKNLGATGGMLCPDTIRHTVRTLVARADNERLLYERCKTQLSDAEEGKRKAEKLHDSVCVLAERSLDETRRLDVEIARLKRESASAFAEWLFDVDGGDELYFRELYALFRAALAEKKV